MASCLKYSIEIQKLAGNLDTLKHQLSLATDRVGAPQANELDENELTTLINSGDDSSEYYLRKFGILLSLVSDLKIVLEISSDEGNISTRIERLIENILSLLTDIKRLGYSNCQVFQKEGDAVNDELMTLISLNSRISLNESNSVSLDKKPKSSKDVHDFKEYLLIENFMKKNVDDETSLQRCEAEFRQVKNVRAVASKIKKDLTKELRIKNQLSDWRECQRKIYKQ